MFGPAAVQRKFKSLPICKIIDPDPLENTIAAAVSCTKIANRLVVVKRTRTGGRFNILERIGMSIGRGAVSLCRTLGVSTY